MPVSVFKGSLHDFVGQYGKLQTVPGSPVLPLIGHILPDCDAAKTLVDPLFGIAFLLLEFLHPRHSQFGIFDLIDPETFY